MASAHAQPAGWSQARPITVTEQSGAALTGYQLRLVVDTSAMAPDAADLRFGADAAGAMLLDHWVESGAGTAATVVWVRVPSLPASGQAVIHQFSGNPGAASTSSLDVFDFDSAVNNSATLQVTGGALSEVINSQRSFRFSPNEDVLLTSLGKNEPNGSTRYITLFDEATQSKLEQLQISGPAGAYSYADVPQPLWLRQGQNYLLSMYQGASDGYYYGSSTQINPRLTYLDMRYCNGCTPDTFPTNYLNAFHYGYPDFQFRTRQQVSPAPVWAYGTVPTAPSLSGAAGDGQASFAIAPPSSDGGSALQSYAVSCTPEGGGSAVGNSASTSPIVVTGLANGTAYGCTATATNAIGTSPASAAVSVTPVQTLGITTTSFGPLRAGEALGGLQLVAQGGIGPYTWSAVDPVQALPAGLGLSPTGLLSGTPSSAGSYSTRVTVTDSRGALQSTALTTKAAVSQVFTGTVAAAAVTPPVVTPPAATPVPTLAAWATLLLSALLAGAVACGRYRRMAANAAR